jgi:hypothetical protein
VGVYDRDRTADVGQPDRDPVFSERFLADLYRRYDNKPLSYQTDLFFVATSSEHSGLREWIERVVALVPEPGRTKLVSRLRADKHLVNTLNELAVAAELQSTGCAVLYEHDLNGVTPDWFVFETAELPALAVEVWSKNLRSGSSSRRRQWVDLQTRIRNIDVDVGLNVVVRSSGGPPSHKTAKAIARELSVWLRETALRTGSTREFDGYQFVVTVGAGKQNGFAEMVIPGESGAYTTEDVLAEIRQKTKRYETAVTARKAAFVVVVAHEPGTPINKSTIADLAAGRQSIMFSFDPASNGLIGDASVQLKTDDTPHALAASVSGVAWVELQPSEQPDQAPTVVWELFLNERRSVDVPEPVRNSSSVTDP